jgi:hypothetical protein
MTEKERYLFDVQGFLLVKGVLSSDQLDRLNRAMERRYYQGKQVGDILEWGNEDLYALAIEPRIDGYLEEMLGPLFRLDHEYAIIHRKGDPPLRLHGGGTPYDPGQYYLSRNGLLYSGLTVVSYALTDIKSEDGGFCCIPGSHKAGYVCPPEFRDLSEGPIVHVSQEAGDAIIFTEALTHGTVPWQGNHERRSLLYKFAPSAVAWTRYDRPPEVLASMPQKLRNRCAPPEHPSPKSRKGLYD